MGTIDQCRTGPTEPPFDRNASRYAQCRVRKRSVTNVRVKSKSIRQKPKVRRSAYRTRGLLGASTVRAFTAKHRLQPDFFRAGAGTISKFARLHNAQFLSTYRSVRLNNSFTSIENRINYFSSGSSMEPHRASAHSSILGNVIQPELGLY